MVAKTDGQKLHDTVEEARLINTGTKVSGLFFLAAALLVGLAVFKSLADWWKPLRIAATLVAGLVGGGIAGAVGYLVGRWWPLLMMGGLLIGALALMWDHS
jgi:hypothetical protein